MRRLPTVQGRIAAHRLALWHSLSDSCPPVRHAAGHAPQGEDISTLLRPEIMIMLLYALKSA